MKIDRLGRHFDRLIGSARRWGVVIAKKAMPYLKARYWAVYLLAFAMGFYLFGPTHGWQKLHRANAARRMAREVPESMATLQRELRRLKKDIQQLTVTPPSASQFTPDQFIRPAAGETVQGYQWILTRHIWRLHPGVDFKAPWGSDVLAAASGRVVSCERSAGGFTIRLSHGHDWQSVYADLAAARVQTGQAVQKGQTIGISGLIQCIKPEQAGFHFGLYHEKKPVDPCKIISGM
jgi:murein DD-endopeptidase MepM/ murein hydrolase activator NlpD